MSIGYEKNPVSANPVSISGNKYMSGIMRCRKSEIDIRTDKYAEINNKIVKKMYEFIFFFLAFRIGTVLC